MERDMKVVCAAAAVFLLATSAAAVAGVQDCAFLLTQGIKNEAVIYNKSTGIKITKDDYCTSRQQSNAKGATIGYGGFTIGGKDESALGELICKQTFSDTELTDTTLQVLRELDPGLIRIISQCMSQSTGGLQVLPQAPDDDTLVVTIEYEPNSRQREYIEITGLQYTGGMNVKCDGELAQRLRSASTDPLRLDRRRSWQMTCTRSDTGQYFEQDGAPKKVLGGVVVLTTTTDPIILKIADRFSDKNEFAKRLDRVESVMQRLQLSGMVLVAAGTVRENGAKDTHIGPVEFTPVHTGPGDYKVAFDKRLQKTPFVIAGSTRDGLEASAMVTKTSVDYFLVHGAQDRSATDTGFWFVAFEPPPIDLPR